MNQVDLKIIWVLFHHTNLSVAQMNQYIGIAYNNLLPHLKNLQQIGFIDIIDNGVGRRKNITLKNITDDMSFIDFLEIIFKPKQNKTTPKEDLQ